MARRNGKDFSTDIASGDEYIHAIGTVVRYPFQNGAAPLRMVGTGRRDTFQDQMGMVDLGDGVAQQPVTFACTTMVSSGLAASQCLPQARFRAVTTRHFR